MATNFLFATCMYVCVIIATTFSSKLPAETNENVNSNPDWNLAMKKRPTENCQHSEQPYFDIREATYRCRCAATDTTTEYYQDAK